jgi:hypothetical protein
MMQKRYSLLFLITLLLTSCSAAAASPTKTATAIPPTVINAPTVTNTPSPTATSIPPIETPLPTLSPVKAYARYQELLKTNDGCRLPCWWGITPGKTSWDNAQKFLQTFTWTEVQGPFNDGSFTGYVHLPLPQEKGTLDHTYSIKNGIVNRIEAYNFDWATSLDFVSFLNSYGAPDEVFIRTYQNDLNESRPYLIDLFYTKLGILMEYSGGRAINVGKKIRNCFDNVDSPFIYLWSPDDKMTSSEAISAFLDTTNLPYPIPLYDATGMSVDSFYKKFRNPDKNNCLETPLALWPNY